MKKLFMLPLLFLTLCGFTAQNTDSIRVTGKITPDSGTTLVTSAVRLVPYKEGDSYSTNVNSDGTFIISLPTGETALYALKYRGIKLNLVLGRNEPECKVVARTDNDGVRTISTRDSRENEAYNKVFRRANNSLEDGLKNLRDDCAADGKNCLVKLRKYASTQNLEMEYLQQKYKGTLAADALSRMAELPEAISIEQFEKHFFDPVDFKDVRIYKTPDLGNKISLFINCLADTNATARLNFLHLLLDKTNGNHEARKELIALLLDNFMLADREPYLSSLVQWASGEPKLADEQPVMSAKLVLLSKVVPGGLAPEVSGDDSSGKVQTLTAATGKNKLTLLIFWESDCPHCRKAMPEFMRLYRKYHSTGLGIFGASLDTDKDKWKQFVQGKQLPWENIILPAERTAHSDYFIQFTPTLVLIDNKGKIINRFIGLSELDGRIGALLGNK
jgi:thiol-disulfide isomerase/thioredoxin